MSTLIKRNGAWVKVAGHTVWMGTKNQLSAALEAGELPDNTEVMVTNDYDEQNVYTEEERVIGKWIDGKPLYRRVKWGDTVNPASGESKVSFADNTWDYVNLYSCMVLTSGNFWAPAARYCQNIWVRRSGQVVCAPNVANTEWTGGKLLAVVEYTKTTD